MIYLVKHIDLNSRIVLNGVAYLLTQNIVAMTNNNTIKRAPPITPPNHISENI